uniref:Uncharacterized protein n=1 Tax=Bionectria ochroleuca TaxID=29856 RepID=A0A8H7K176_BIOOC
MSAPLRTPSPPVGETVDEMVARLSATAKRHADALASARKELAKAKRKKTRAEKAYSNQVERADKCTVCVKSLASGKSDGRCCDYDGNGGRCVRCDKGGNVCVTVPLVLMPLARNLAAAREVLSGLPPVTGKLEIAEHAAARLRVNHASTAWKLVCDLACDGGFDGLTVVEREEGGEPAVSDSVKQVLKRRPVSAPKTKARKPKSSRAAGAKGNEGDSSSLSSAPSSDDESDPFL